MCAYGQISKKSRVDRAALILFYFYFFYYRQNRKYSFPVLESVSSISFLKFPVSRHLLKLSYVELRSFSTFFALNFNKKLAVE